MYLANMAFLSLIGPAARAIEPTSAEQQSIAGRFDEWLTGERPALPPPPFIEVLRHDYAGLERRRSVLLMPLRIGSRGFERGLGTHAASHLRVHLPPDAVRFTAQVGIDSNYDTGGERGSVSFAVHVGEDVVASSPVLRGPDEAYGVDAALGDARVIDLHVSNGGDGDSHDQCDWADAAIVTKDAEKLWLDDMPIIDTTWLGDGPPFSFVLGEEPSGEVLSRCEVRREAEAIDEFRSRHRVSYRDPQTEMEIAVEAIRYTDSSAVEWALHFHNAAPADSLVLQDIRPLDMVLRRAGGPRECFLLKGARGGVCTPEDFQPVEIPLRQTETAELSARGGRSSNRHLPFFNIDAVERGLTVAVGWSGEWAADFAADGRGYLRVQAGMEKTHLKLPPGETVRSPRILTIAWEGDPMRGHNMMRQLIYRHHTPLLSGEKPLPPVQCNTWFPVGDDGNKANEANQIELLRAYAPLGIEYMVMDAGWFVGGWPGGVGNWTPREDSFPNGLKTVGEAAREAGIEFGMWFEPERVSEGSWLDREHPEWLLTVDGNSTRLLNLGLPEVQEWFVNMVSGYVEGVPLGYFRHDFNMEPLPYWQAADGPDRVGMTEIRYVEGLYSIWDELHARFPDLLMEGCASGGRRMDLESLSRCHTYWKSDLYGNLTANQGHTYGASLYMPGNYLNTPLFDLSDDPYAFRSGLGAALCLGWDPRAPGFNAALATERIQKFRALRHLAVGEFYPVTGHSLSAGDWIGYQLHRPDLGEGAVLLFRREESPYVSADIHLSGLSEEATYELTFADTGEKRRATGQDLAAPLRVTIDRPGSSILITYRKAD